MGIGYLSVLRFLGMKLSGLLAGRTAPMLARWLAGRFVSALLWQRQTYTPYSFEYRLEKDDGDV